MRKVIRLRHGIDHEHTWGIAFCAKAPWRWYITLNYAGRWTELSVGKGW